MHRGNLHKADLYLLQNIVFFIPRLFFNMISGLVPPTSGKIIVDNYDVVMHTCEARERISYCPSGNVLFEELTVEEHLLFFAMVRVSPLLIRYNFVL